jgi:phenylpyruvate tautomerase PptA (4-oxalocrotonate tautomerase family)
MPLWTIHHSPGVFSQSDKQQLAANITAHYEKIGLPRFYVMTVFSEISPDDFFVGGEAISTGVRIVIDHIARHAADQAGRQRTAQWIKSMLTPFLDTHPDLHWEFHVDDTSEDLWMINGIVPPPGGSPAEKHWAVTNATSEYATA